MGAGYVERVPGKMGLTQQTGKEEILTGYIVRYKVLQIHIQK